jgi:predicted lipoprotein with Yx(FWY)xxD motif
MHTRLTPILAVAAAVLSAAVATGASARADRAAARATVAVAKSTYGQILFDGRGFALYAFTRDPRGRSACSGACAKAWPPYIVRGRLVAGGGTRASLLGTTRRADGSRQLTYAGRPLYYYVGDREAGQVLCQNVVEFGGTWLVVRGSGKLVR